jgi:hypothetical protein
MRAQGILAVAIDASEFAARRTLHKHELHGLAAFRANSLFALRHWLEHGRSPSGIVRSVRSKSRFVNI